MLRLRCGTPPVPGPIGYGPPELSRRPARNVRALKTYLPSRGLQRAWDGLLVRLEAAL